MLLFFLLTRPLFRGEVENCKKIVVVLKYLKTRKKSSEISWPLVQLIKAIHSWTLCAYNLVFKTVVCVLGMARGVSRSPRSRTFFHSLRNKFYHSSVPWGPRQNSLRTSKIQGLLKMEPFFTIFPNSICSRQTFLLKY